MTTAVLKTLREIVPGRVWGLTSSFRMFGLISINNNGLIVKVRKQGEPVLVAVNAPKLTPDAIHDLHELERRENAKISYILASDWHHLFMKSWANEFNATVFFSATRGWRLHENESFDKEILDRVRPQIPNLDDVTIRLVPWLGFDGVFVNHPDEKRRGEYSVYLPDLKLLYIFDILIPMLPLRNTFFFSRSTPQRPWKQPRSNFGGRMSGFHVVDPKLCSESAKTLLELDIDVMVFAHGDFDGGAILNTKEEIKFAIHGLQVLVKDA